MLKNSGNKVFLSVLAFFLCCSRIVMAHEHDSHQHYQVGIDAHQHGVGTLNWVMEGELLNISLISPAINLLGFEHAPVTLDEKQQFDNMVMRLNNSDNVITFDGGECSLSSVAVTMPFEDDQETEMHADILVEYAYLCEKPLELETMSIDLFDNFSGFEALDVQWIIDDEQGSAILDHFHHLLKVR